MAGSRPAGAGGEAAGEGLGTPVGPSIPLLYPLASVPRLPPASRLAASPRGDPRPPPEPDAVSAPSCSASGRGPRRAGRAPRPAPHPHATLPLGRGGGVPRGPPGHLRAEGWAGRGPALAVPGARTLACPPRRAAGDPELRVGRAPTWAKFCTRRRCGRRGFFPALFHEYNQLQTISDFLF